VASCVCKEKFEVVVTGHVTDKFKVVARGTIHISMCSNVHGHFYSTFLRDILRLMHDISYSMFNEPLFMVGPCWALLKPKFIN